MPRLLRKTALAKRITNRRATRLRGGIMTRSATQSIVTNRTFEITRQIVIVVSASIFIALCARVTIPLPFTPVPLTLQNFGVLLVGLSLGSRRGFLALMLYLAEGASGMPVFNPAGPGGFAQ